MTSHVAAIYAPIKRAFKAFKTFDSAQPWTSMVLAASRG